MAEVSVKLDEQMFRNVAGATLFEMMEPALRERILREAIEQTLKTPQYGRASPLQLAFDAAVEEKVREFVREQVAARPEIIDKVRSWVVAAIDKMLETDYEISNAVTTAIVNELWKRRDR